MMVHLRQPFPLVVVAQSFFLPLVSPLCLGWLSLLVLFLPSFLPRFGSICRGSLAVASGFCGAGRWEGGSVPPPPPSFFFSPFLAAWGEFRRSALSFPTRLVWVLRRGGLAGRMGSCLPGSFWPPALSLAARERGSRGGECGGMVVVVVRARGGKLSSVSEYCGLFSSGTGRWVSWGCGEAKSWAALAAFLRGKRWLLKETNGGGEASTFSLGTPEKPLRWSDLRVVLSSGLKV